MTRPFGAACAKRSGRGSDTVLSPSMMRAATDHRVEPGDDGGWGDDGEWGDDVTAQGGVPDGGEMA